MSKSTCCIIKIKEKCYIKHEDLIKIQDKYITEHWRINQPNCWTAAELLQLPPCFVLCCLNRNAWAAGWHDQWSHSLPLLAAGQCRVHICLPGRIIYSPADIGSGLITFSWKISLSTTWSTTKEKQNRFFLGVHRLSWNESKTNKQPTFSWSWNTDRC